MRRLLVVPLVFLAACSGEANHLGNPLLLPINGLFTGIENASYGKRRGKVEVAVKSNWPTILAEIKAGEGPTLTQAMNAARIPSGDRPARILQMQGDLAIFEGQPENLVVSLMVYGT